MNLQKFILLIFLLAIAIQSFSQIPRGAGAGRPRSMPQGGTRPGNSTYPGQLPNDPARPENEEDTPKKGKLLDDSTKLIYGPKTVKYFLEVDVFNNRKLLYDIDTLLDGFHIFNFLQINKNLVQDIGNFGSASRTVFFNPINQIGTQLGFNAYDIYHKQSHEVKYFDSKSPYTNMYFVRGGRGEQMLKFDFNRSVNARWNVGLNLQNFVAAKQYGALGGRGQNSIRNWNVVFHNSYFSKDSNYTILANFNYFKHSSIDDGGVRITPIASGGVASEDPYITSATTEQKSKQLHIYQQFALANGFQVYHILDITRQDNSFVDTDYSTGFDAKIYKTKTALGITEAIPTDSIFRKYRLIENKVGLKGFVKGFNYRAHFRRRDYKLTDSLDTKYIPESLIKRHENFVGGWLNYYFKDSTKAFVETEYLIGKDFNFKVEYLRKLLNLGYYTVLSSPTLVQERYHSNLAAWRNKFENSFSTTFFGKINYRKSNTIITPRLTYSLLNNTIYFDTLATPKQSNKLITILQAGTGFEYRKNKFITKNQVFITLKTGPDIIRMPTLLINSMFAYNFTYAKKLSMQAGMDLHYKSAYYAYAYMPVIQQFYLQDKINVKQGIMADVFVNMKLNRVRFLLKYSQLNNLILGDYFVGPQFKGLKGGLSFGVSWPLFD